MSLLLVLIVIVLGLLVPTAYAGFIGAPYVPVRRVALKKTFDSLKIGPGDALVDLGAGDGGVLIEATRRGAKAIGYELSPIMWVIARARGATVYLRNFFSMALPADTTVVYVFLMPKAMPRLLKYLQQQKLPHAKYLVCYTFGLPKITPTHIIQTKTHGTTYVYAWSVITGQKG